MVMSLSSVARSPQDFWKLSYDKEDREVNNEIDKDELDKKIRILESVIKKKKQRG